MYPLILDQPKRKKRQEETQKPILDEEIELEKVKFEVCAKLEIRNQRKHPWQVHRILAVLWQNYQSLRNQSFKEPLLIR